VTVAATVAGKRAVAAVKDLGRSRRCFGNRSIQVVRWQPAGYGIDCCCGILLTKATDSLLFGPDAPSLCCLVQYRGSCFGMRQKSSTRSTSLFPS